MNKVIFIKDGQTVLRDGAHIGDYLLRNFQVLYDLSNSYILVGLEGLTNPCISAEDKEDMLRIYIEIEIRKV